MFGEVVEGIDAHSFETALADLKRARGVQQDTDLDRRRSSRAGRDVPQIYRDGSGSDFPRDAREQLLRAVRAVFDSWDNAARAGLPACARDPGRHRHRGQRRADGVRQQGRPLGHGRRVHARPVDGRDGALRRVPRERAGRGRRRRHPHAAADRGDALDRCRMRSTSCSTRCAGSRSTTATCRTSSSRSRTSSSTCCRRARRSAPPPAALKAAVTMVERGPDLARGGDRAHRPGAARPAAPSDDRPPGDARGRREGPERVAGRRERRDRLRRRHRGRARARTAR